MTTHLQDGMKNSCDPETFILMNDIFLVFKHNSYIRSYDVSKDLYEYQ